MQEQSNGFLAPVITKSQVEQEDIILRVCPGVNIVNDQHFGKQDRIWGNVLGSYSGFSTSKHIRTRGSSGGIISAVAIFLLENDTVDAVLQVGGDFTDYRRNCLRVSKTRDEVLACSASRYAPSSVFKGILDVLLGSEDRYLFIGKPCDISGLKNFLNEYPQFKERFKFFVSIICAGIPSFHATQDVIDTFDQVRHPVRDLAYRGNGWPGFFSFLDANGNKFQMSYNDSWGKKLGKKLHFRCKICPDGIGLQADLAAGDAWETKDGYPDFAEREGQSLILLRTSRAVDLLRAMQHEEQVVLQTLPMEKIRSMQPYQYIRRSVVGSRVLATIIGKGILLNFKGMRIWNNLFSKSIASGFREFIGTLKRILIDKR
ncbi:coenzyme F420-dependent oxidoreductase [Geofilum rubicundum JCM 15548]|uniref:Coenzyme F420-dependent oxidoreductase n=2 Tax=Geofilum TaxID=1236988 RepID=A0A0E9M274_9BACT|nr:coenzyme F420-dependent oxidoreductase [Geofilum rubicundum JCM 15548]